MDIVGSEAARSEGSAVTRLIAALDEVAAEAVAGRPLRDALLALDAARARLDAQVARRLHAFDASREWAAEGAHSAAAFLVARTRCARGDAHRYVRVARELAELDDTSRHGPPAP